MPASAADRGHVTPAFVGVVGMTMVLLALLANVLFVRYAEGVLHVAAEAGLRRGLAVADAAECVLRAEQALDAGLGPMAAQVDTPTCTLDAVGGQVSIQARFVGWMPLVGDRDVAVRASTSVPVGP